VQSCVVYGVLCCVRGVMECGVACVRVCCVFVACLLRVLRVCCVLCVLRVACVLLVVRVCCGMCVVSACGLWYVVCGVEWSGVKGEREEID
jgi:hypothetical protein